MWQDEMYMSSLPPYSTTHDSLFVAYYASAELGCHLALDWPTPQNILDLYVEFRNLTNGNRVPCGAGLLGAMASFGLPAAAAVEKDEMRRLAGRGGPYTDVEQDSLMAYCESDVDALVQLLDRMATSVDLDRALLRGRYMAAVAVMERIGIPIDVEMLERLRRHWGELRIALIERVDRAYGVFEGSTFKRHRFERLLERRGILWPRLKSGQLSLDDNTFKGMAAVYPAVAELRELRITLAQLRTLDLAIGGDGRNRVLLSALRSKTGRNQPSNSRFIFGPSTWTRGLIRPDPGMAIAYVDWGQQEFGIAAALSGDARMMEAYQSEDPYLKFAIQAGSAPEDAAKASHPDEREAFKQCALAVLFGMGEKGLALRIRQSPAEARRLLALHHRTFPTFWRWSDAAVDFAMLHGHLHTVFGWNLNVGGNPNPRSLRNFPMQANGSEMLRLACCFATEAGIRVCAPVHDALVVEGPIDDIEEVVDEARRCMAEASRIVLGGFELRTDVKIVRYPDRYMDKRGERMWKTVIRLLDEIK